MTTQNEARERIYQTFVDEWSATPVARVTYDNEAFDPPANLSWVRLTVRHTGSAQESLGPVGRRKFERIGSVIVQCFTPLDTGAAGADTLAQAARTIFEGRTLSPEAIRFTDCVVREIGVDGAWFQANAEAFFTYTETK